MRRGMWVGVLILVILVAIGVGVGAYNAGVTHGLQESAQGGDVVRVIGPGFGFPFGLILFPLFFFGIFFLLRAAFWHRTWGGPGRGPWGPGHWGGGGHLDEWHRRQHEEGAGERTVRGDEAGTA